ncbi:Fc.00g095460.m01.CDS01 [Cosmosporella sp. VM-42]
MSQVEEHDHHVMVNTDTFDIAEEALEIDLPKKLLASVTRAITWVGLLSANLLALINEDIGPSDNITWVTLANALGLSVAFLLVRRMSDIFGRCWFFVIGNLFALFGCIICGTASSVNAIIGGNVLSGLARAVQITFTAAISERELPQSHPSYSKMLANAHEVVPNKHRPLWAGGLLFSSFPAMTFGPVIAQEPGTDTATGWRWCFYQGIIVSGITIILLYFCYHPPNFGLLHQNRSRIQPVKRMDFIGVALFTGGLIFFLMGLSWGGSQYPWKSAYVIATIVVGFFSLAAFAIYDGYYKCGSLMPLHLFKTREYAAMIVTATVASCVYFSMGVLWPQQVASLIPGSHIHRGFLAICLVKYPGHGTWP